MGLNIRNIAKEETNLRESVDFNFKDISIWVLSSFTINQIDKMISLELLKEKYNPSIKFTEYNQYQTQILDPNSILRKSEIDIAIFAIQIDDLLPNFFENYYSSESLFSFKNLKDAVSEYIQLIRKLKEDTGCTCIVNDFAFPSRSINEIQENTDLSSKVQDLNRYLREELGKISGVYIAGFESLLFKLGMENSIDSRMKYFARAPYSSNFLFELSSHYRELINTLYRPRKKVLVFDLDNTLWGGVIGEDGIKGISIGNDYPGNIYLEIQRLAKKYSELGIILAINSKNNFEDVEEVFNNHPEIILSMEDFSAKKINWENKDKNLIEISEELNVGLDAMVFVDDSPYEIGIVNNSIPEVETIQFTDDLISNLERLKNISSFNTLGITEEDLKKKKQYKDEAKRKEFESKSGSLDDYLANLNISVSFKPINENNFARALQLINKTNQFNLTTRRYKELELEEKLNSSKSRGFTIGVKDKFGDSGIVGVAIIEEKESKVWEIDTFLLSCRVLGRGIESAFLSALADYTKTMSADSLVGIYISSKKNKQVEHFYKNNGFIKKDEDLVLDLSNKGKIPKAPSWITLRD